MSRQEALDELERLASQMGADALDALLQDATALLDEQHRTAP
ncbi:MAG: hypothetical protein ACXV3V_11040 [Actinomycetes bacterium]